MRRTTFARKFGSSVSGGGVYAMLLWLGLSALLRCVIATPTQHRFGPAGAPAEERAMTTENGNGAVRGDWRLGPVRLRPETQRDPGAETNASRATAPSSTGTMPPS